MKRFVKKMVQIDIFFFFLAVVFAIPVHAETLSSDVSGSTHKEELLTGLFAGGLFILSVVYFYYSKCPKCESDDNVVPIKKTKFLE